LSTRCWSNSADRNGGPTASFIELPLQDHEHAYNVWKVPSLSDIITPGKVKPEKLLFNLPPPSWPPSDKSVKTDVTSEVVDIESSKSSTATGGVQGAVTGAGTSVDPPKATTQTLARNKELAGLLAEYNSGGVKDLLTAQESSVTTTSRSTSSGEKTLKKPLLIPDHINYWNGLEDDDDDSFVTTQGKTFKLEGRRRRLSPREVSIPQWLSANLNILELLSDSLTPLEVKQYLDYTKQIGDLLQIYMTGSVFCLDDSHRRDVHRGIRQWNAINGHQERFFLVCERSVGVSSSASSSASGSTSGRRRRNRPGQPCVAYNTVEGCKYRDNCKFPHICSDKLCGGSHPRHLCFRTTAKPAAGK
jgi:hypothetical protein